MINYMMYFAFGLVGEAQRYPSARSRLGAHSCEVAILLSSTAQRYDCRQFTSRCDAVRLACLEGRALWQIHLRRTLVFCHSPHRRRRWRETPGSTGCTEPPRALCTHDGSAWPDYRRAQQYGSYLIQKASPSECAAPLSPRELEVSRQLVLTSTPVARLKR